jgi:phenylacetate-CoA ligase
LEVLPEGADGELVFTTITKEGLPLLRYRTRDLSCLNYAPCRCGRTLVRMKKCTGRSDDMLIIRGVNVFPSQVESVLLELKETSPHYLLVVDRVNNLDVLELQVEMEESFSLDRISELQALIKRIQRAMESSLGLSLTVKIMESKTIPRSEGKAVRVIDKRKI